MTVQEALTNLDQAVAQIQANRQVHAVLQESLKTVFEATRNLHEKAEKESK